MEIERSKWEGYKLGERGTRGGVCKVRGEGCAKWEEYKGRGVQGGRGTGRVEHKGGRGGKAGAKLRRAGGRQSSLALLLLK